MTGDTKVTGLRVRNVKTGQEHAINIGGVFEAIGHEPHSELFTGQLDTGPDGYVLIDPPSTRTTLAGVFACGDVVDRTCRQAMTVAGTGAAIDAERWLGAQEP
jgi:thioredoxin reductase (NADPH)